MRLGLCVKDRRVALEVVSLRTEGDNRAEFSILRRLQMSKPCLDLSQKGQAARRHLEALSERRGWAGQGQYVLHFLQ